MTRLDEACNYARLKMRVFPVRWNPGGDGHKAPMPGYAWRVSASSKINEVVEDFDRAIQLWGDENVMVAWALGEDGFMAVDLDTGDEPDWVQAFDWAAAENKTAKGRHLVTLFPEAFEPGNGANNFPTKGWGEVRGRGGYIIIAGPDRPGFDGTQLQRCKPFPRPEWLQAYGGPVDAVSRQEVVEFATRYNSSSNPNFIHGLETACAEFEQGWEANGRPSRHMFAVWAVTCAAEDAIRGQYAFKDGLAVVKAMWQRIKPEARPREWDDILAWSVGKALANQGQPTVGTAEDESEALLGDNSRPLLSPLDWSTFRQRERHVDDWLVEGFWPRRRAMLCHAKAGTGKSELALYVASCMALGVEPWSGYKVEPVKVAYFDFEMDEDQIDDRLSDLGYDDSFDLSNLANLSYYCLPPIAKLDTSHGALVFLEAIERDRAEAVVIDTFSRVITDDENEAKTVQRFYEFTGRELKRRGVGQWRIDHTGKDASKGARGSSAKNEDVDFVWDMKRTDDGQGVRLTATKQRAQVDTPLILRRDDDPFVRYRRDGDISTMVSGVDVTAKVHQLEALGLDPSWGFDKVRQALVEAGLEVGRKVTLQAAIRYRKDAYRRGVVIAKPAGAGFAKPQLEPAPGLRLVEPVDNPDE